MTMNRQASLNLDLTRWLAAMAVFSTHFVQQGTASLYRDQIEPLGRLGVVIFFVLSGYVISATVAEKHVDMLSYMAARFGRLHSVLVPALGLTWVADVIGRLYDAGLYARFPDPFSIKTVLVLPLMASFLYENTAFSARWLSNSPMWSIAYEFWYYVAFGAVYFYQGRARIILLALTLTLAGWKILLLSPAWLLGVLIHRCGRHLRLAGWARVLGIVGSLTAMGILISPQGFKLLEPLRQAGNVLPAGYHSMFLSDWVISVPVGALVWLLTVPAKQSWPVQVTGLIRKLAGGSFALYLFHLPLIYLCRALQVYDPASWIQCCVTALVVLATCHILAAVTEANKRPWVRWAEQCLHVITRSGTLGKKND